MRSDTFKGYERDAIRLTKLYKGTTIGPYPTPIIEFIVAPYQSKKLQMHWLDYIQRNQDEIINTLNNLKDNEIILCVVFEGKDSSHPEFVRYSDFIREAGIR